MGWVHRMYRGVDVHQAHTALQNHPLQRNVDLESIVRDKVLEVNLGIAKLVMSASLSLLLLLLTYQIHLKVDHVLRGTTVLLEQLQQLVLEASICRIQEQLPNQNAFLVIQENIAILLEGHLLMVIVRRDIFALEGQIQRHLHLGYVLRDISVLQGVHHLRLVLCHNIKIYKARKHVSHVWRGFNAQQLLHLHVQRGTTVWPTM